MGRVQTVAVLTVSYRYGIVGRPAVPAAATAQLRLAHRMRNALVELEQVHDEALRSLWTAHPEVGRLEVELAKAQTLVDDLLRRAAAQHSQDRSVATRP